MGLTPCLKKVVFPPSLPHFPLDYKIVAHLILGAETPRSACISHKCPILMHFLFITLLAEFLLVLKHKEPEPQVQTPWWSDSN